MTTAITHRSLRQRVRMAALATTIALGSALSGISPITADEPWSDAVPGEVSTTSPVAEQGFAGTSVVVDTPGDGLILRAEPYHTAEALGSLPNGAPLTLRTDVLDTVYDPDGVTRWWPIVDAGGTNAWVSGELIADAGAPALPDVPADTADLAAKDGVESTVDTSVPATDTSFEYHEQATAESFAIVASGGAGVNVRTEPQGGSDVIAAVSDGERISLRIHMVDTVFDDAGNRWWPVSVNGQDGWISGSFLTHGDAEAIAPDPVPAETTEAVEAPGTEEVPAQPAFDYTGEIFPGITAVVISPEGTNLRAEPNAAAEVLTPVNAQAVVTLRIEQLDTVYDEAGTRWWPVSVDGQAGWISGFVLGSADAVAAEAPVVDDVTAPAEPSDPGETSEPTAAAETPVPAEEPAPTEEPTPTEEALAPTEEPFPTDEPPAPTAEPTPAATEPPVSEEEAVEEDVSVAPSTGATGSFIYPLESYTRTQGFGCSDLGFYPYNPDWGCAVHDGLDLAAPSGTPLLASDGGTVIASGWCDCGLGFYVEIDHGNGLTTIYGHMAEQPPVQVGQQVAQGEFIGPVGSTGLSTGPHVHFMVRDGGVAQDPEAYLP